ncbi:30S ribosomal protein S14 (plastid) [Chondrus crispus]|uniref:Small ribosomal subunit protein uS14c n=1 Tax=Chondrus crispus TaxID=2769 RepID=M5DCX8_CHOCR|nr:30S ribosomal protein S14 [Chondrus crispus]CCP38140.1 30S ribosomal protein S14 [Chondrus crispus]|eukprot:YP_007627393.1 30S ribosomal protein S14 (plastid) [Chondrus crispus]
MAKKSMIQREKKRQALVKKYQTERKNIKNSIKLSSNFIEKIELQKKLQKLPRNSAKCRLRNRCWMTGRSRGVYSDFGLSRHVFREMSHECLLPGITKSSW